MLGMVRCMSSVACCMLHVACRMFACCHRSNPFPHAFTHAQTHLSVWPWPMQRSSKRASVTPRARTESVTALLLCWPQLPLHTLCTAAAPHPSLHSSVGLQLQQITKTEKALLAGVTEKNPDASYVELRRLFKVRRSVADGHS